LDNIRQIGCLLLLLAVLFTAAPERVDAQFVGYVGLQTVNVKPLNAVTAPTTATVQNIGQASHILYYCVTGTPSALVIQLEGSFDGSTWAQLSDQGTAVTGCNVVEGGGYYPALRVNLVTLSGGTSPTVTAYYSGVTAPITGAGAGVSRPRALGVSATQSYLLYNSANKQSAYAASSCILAPAGAMDLLSIYNPSTSTKSIYLDSAIIASSATSGTITEIVSTTTAGASCTNPTIHNLAVASSNTSVATAAYSCSTNPTQNNVIYQMGGLGLGISNLPALGLVVPPGNGLEVYVTAAATGDICTNLTWYEQ
jgi:hypothetical protein